MLSRRFILSTVYGLCFLGCHSFQVAMSHEMYSQFSAAFDIGSVYQRDKMQLYGPNYNIWNWNSSMHAMTSSRAVLSEYDDEWLRIVGGSDRLKDESIGVAATLSGVSSIYRSKSLTPYMSAYYHYRFGPWLLNIGGNGTGWSAVTAKIFSVGNGEESQGRVHFAQQYRLNGSVGYEFMPDWMLKVGYAGEFLPQKKEMIKTYLNGSLTNRRSQHFLSLGVQGMF